uniref:Hexosyltransferase n=1 Tax=Geotrypetes seraphini TaxID=260995 RepID=A0A6P8Q6W0_GEOSA|nr:beta-1,3-galactosyltransferase 5-like [Geotrypetes seraphini]XP_033792025.1 beta-1,3-galactosyltransferase 5-like [Geotrypetes seraphini]XP_033792034.1 beta-1,3-galactosyltransferase 5-like [Geotrypetes seraphini]XP_033792042.1 beta-1,3-galactosyltransferase 5-like [Geotrypetes seraphini]XP_033792050.1 beta-1,3-galactosyltransferase 5-like [Geotrypetes seraphini]XP_033792059.1 beta-1,3-galactosyltransferase 5-like [Geotrypetes seraphini]
MHFHLKGVLSSVLLLLILFWYIFVGIKDKQEPRGVKKSFSVFKAKHPIRPSKGDLIFTSLGVDFPSLFAASFPEPRCDTKQVLMVLVTSAPRNVGAREVIRKTWAAKEKWAPFAWQTVFLIGQTLADGITQRIQKEQQNFGDILVGDYLDTYRNLTLKVMHGLKWATERCQPDYILKTDDDCFVNSDRLPMFLAVHNTIKTGLYVGALFSQEKRKVIREPSSLWYVAREDYWPDEYPPYVSGIGYILSLDVASKLLLMAEYIHPIPVEDAYIGILATEAGIQVKASRRFAKYNMKWRVCNYRYLMVIHHVSTQGQELANVNMVKARTACRNNTEVIHWK